MYHRSSSLGMFCEICFPSHFCFSSTGPVIWHRKIKAQAREYIGLEKNFSLFIGQLCISSYLSRYFPSTTFLSWNKLHCIPHSDFLNLTLIHNVRIQLSGREEGKGKYSRRRVSFEALHSFSLYVAHCLIHASLLILNITYNELSKQLVEVTIVTRLKIIHDSMSLVEVNKVSSFFW